MSDYKTISFCRELETVFIEVHSAAILRAVKPDYNVLQTSSDSVKEVVITAASDEPSYDFLLRSFCPWIGINEDPVTGSVHSVLAHYWKHRTGKSSLKAWQASERGGEVYIQAAGDRVLLGGKTVNILEARALISDID